MRRAATLVFIMLTAATCRAACPIFPVKDRNTSLDLNEMCQEIGNLPINQFDNSAAAGKIPISQGVGLPPIWSPAGTNGQMLVSSGAATTWGGNYVTKQSSSTTNQTNSDAGNSTSYSTGTYKVTLTPTSVNSEIRVTVQGDLNCNSVNCCDLTIACTQNGVTKDLSPSALGIVRHCANSEVPVNRYARFFPTSTSPITCVDWLRGENADNATFCLGGELCSLDAEERGPTYPGP